MAKIIIPTPLRKFTENQSAVEVTGQTVKEAILDLSSKFEGLSKQILDADGNLRSFIRLYVGEEDINVLEKEKTTIEAGSVLSIVPAIAGGSI